MNIKFLGHDETHNPSGGLCNEYRIDEIKSLDSLIDFYHQKSQEYSNQRILLTLDDVSQACYTSGHARMTYDLADSDGLDLSGLPTECFDEGEYLGYLNTSSEMFICQHNFQRLIKDVTFEQVCEKGLTLTDENLEEWIEYQTDPFSIFDSPVSALVVPVNHSYETLYAFPNGYFSCDLSPAENFILAKRFQQQYGLELIGIGASYLGFIRKEPLTDIQLNHLCEDLLLLYHVVDSEKEKMKALFSQMISDSELLWVKYTD